MAASSKNTDGCKCGRPLLTLGTVRRPPKGAILSGQADFWPPCAIATRTFNTSAGYHNGSENGAKSRARAAMRPPHKGSPCEAGRIALRWQVTCAHGVVVIIPSLGVIIMALEVVLGSNPSGRRFLNLFAEEEGR